MKKLIIFILVVCEMHTGLFAADTKKRKLMHNNGVRKVEDIRDGNGKLSRVRPNPDEVSAVAAAPGWGMCALGATSQPASSSIRGMRLPSSPPVGVSFKPLAMPLGWGQMVGLVFVGGASSLSSTAATSAVVTPYCAPFDFDVELQALLYPALIEPSIFKFQYEDSAGAYLLHQAIEKNRLDVVRALFNAIDAKNLGIGEESCQKQLILDR